MSEELTLPEWSEDERLRELASFDIIDTPAEADFDEIATLAARICDTPIALLNLKIGRAHV